MKNFSKKTQRLFLFLALILISAILPFLIHLFGADAGKMFLPMQIPVITAGLLLGPFVAIGLAVFSVFASFFLSGMSMPNLDMLPFVLIELVCIGSFAGAFSGLTKKNVFLTPVGVVSAAILGRGLYIGILAFSVNVLPLLKLEALKGAPALNSVWEGLAVSYPGVILQLICVPLLAFAAKKVTTIYE